MVQWVEIVVFAVCAAIVLAGGLGVVMSRRPVHSALSLVATLFGIAVLFINQNAQFLGAVQVIVYTGAIVVLILFVLMLLGVDKEEDLTIEPLVAQRGLAALAAIAIVGGVFVALMGEREQAVTGEVAVTQAIYPEIRADDAQGVVAARRELTPEARQVAADGNIGQIGELLFTRYVFAFQVTAALLTIAVVGAVVMARRPKRYEPLPEPGSFELEPLEQLAEPGEAP